MPRLAHEHTRLDFSHGGQVYNWDVPRRVANLNRILTDIDLALTTEIEKLKLQDGDSERVRAQIETLKEKHQQLRNRFVRRLAELPSDTTG